MKTDLPLGLSLLAADRVPSGREMYDEAERLQKAERQREIIRREAEERAARECSSAK